MSRPSLGQWAMHLAQVTSYRSTCCRRQVGCVLLNSRGHILATGYNGVAAGLPHCNEVTSTKVKTPYWEADKLYGNACSGAKSPSGTNLDGCEAIHAEQNALLQCRNVYEIETCVVTASPCITCVKLLMNTSCTKIIFMEEYPHSQAKDLWLRAWNEGSGPKKYWIQSTL